MNMRLHRAMYVLALAVGYLLAESAKRAAIPGLVTGLLFIAPAVYVHIELLLDKIDQERRSERQREEQPAA